MAKSKKEDKASKKALSGGSLFQQNAVSMLYSLGKQPDIDEVLRKAGVARHRLKILLDDDEIAQAVETRIDALLATPFRIEPSDTPEAMLLIQELKEWFTEISTGALNALFFGYSVQESVYELKPEGHIGLQWIGEKPMQWFEPKNDGRLIYRPEGTGQEVVVDQKLKFFLTRRKATYEQPYGKALLATLYWLNFFKQNGFKFWAKFLERFGTPILLGKCKDSDTNDMNQALLNAHAQSVLSIDSEDDVQVLTSGSNGTAGTSFETFNNVLIRQIQKVILGQTLTSGTDGTGSRALGQVHENVRKDKLNADVRLVTPTFQAIVNALCALNNWTKHEVYLGEKTKQLNVEQAERDVKLKTAGANLTQQYFTREYGLQDGDIAETQEQAPKTFSATPKRAFSFKADMQGIDLNQQEVDDKVDAIDKQLFSESELLKVVESSTDFNDLQAKLYESMSSESVEKFNATMARALYLFDVVGYVQRSK